MRSLASHIRTDAARTALAALLLVPLASGALTVEELASRLLARDTVVAAFEMARTVPGIALPIPGRGTLEIHRGKSFAWRQSEPEPLEILVSASGMTVRRAGEPDTAVRQDGKVLALMLNPTLQSLSDGFEATLSDGEPGRWVLELVPKGANPLAQIVTRMIVSGRNSVETVRLLEQGGAATDITFREGPRE